MKRNIIKISLSLLFCSLTTLQTSAQNIEAKSQVINVGQVMFR